MTGFIETGASYLVFEGMGTIAGIANGDCSYLMLPCPLSKVAELISRHHGREKSDREAMIRDAIVSGWSDESIKGLEQRPLGLSAWIVRTSRKDNPTSMIEIERILRSLSFAGRPVPDLTFSFEEMGRPLACASRIASFILELESAATYRTTPLLSERHIPKPAVPVLQENFADGELNKNH